MAVMKKETGSLAKMSAIGAKNVQDLEVMVKNSIQDKMKNGISDAERAYQNSAIQAANKENYGLRGGMEALVEEMAEMKMMMVELYKENVRLQQEVNVLKSQVVKNWNNTEISIKEETVTTTTTTTEVKVTGSREKCEELAKAYRGGGVNIKWDCGIPPMDIIFNEFDLYQEDLENPVDISAYDVGMISATIKSQCKARTGRTTGQVIKLYNQRIR